MLRTTAKNEPLMRDINPYAVSKETRGEGISLLSAPNMLQASVLSKHKTAEHQQPPSIQQSNHVLNKQVTLM